MRSSWHFLLSFLLTLAVLPAYASVTYSPVTLDAVAQGTGSNMVYTTSPVVLDSAGYARTTGAVTTMGSRIGFPAAVRAARYPSSLVLRTAGRLTGPYGLLLLGAIELYDYFKSSGLVECADDKTAWCVSVQPIGTTCGPNAVDGWPMCYAFYYNHEQEKSCTGVVGSPSYAVFWFKVPVPDGAISSCVITNPKITERKAEPADFDKVAVPMPMPVISSSWSKVTNEPLPIDAWDTTGTRSQWLGDPYQGADGKWRRDAITINPSNSTFPPVARVSTTTYGPKDSPDDLKADTPPSTGQDPDAVSDADLCAINPNIIACADKEEVYARLSPSSAVSSALTQQQFEESDKKFGDAIDAVGAGLPPDNTISSAEAAYDGVDNIIQNIDSANLPTLANIEPPSYSQCKTISFTFKDQPFVFPNAEQCQKIEQLKTSFGYFLAGLVLLSLVWQLLTRPQG